MLSAGNHKLGLISNFSLEAGKTCPGKTPTCSDVCYAKKGFFVMQSVRETHERRWEQAKAADFEDKMVEEITSKGIQLVRIHASGDFKTMAYTRKWYNIMCRCKNTTFFLYTRSWRVEEIRVVLWSISRLANVRLWFSCDKDTGIPPRWRNIRLAYMSVSDEDLPSYKVDLIFRDQDQTPMIRDPLGSLVCPYEQGVKRRVPAGDSTAELKMTCLKCRLCFDKDRFIWARPSVSQKEKSDGEEKGKAKSRSKTQRHNSPRRLPKVAAKRRVRDS